jgi:hypothetical protein
MQPDTHIRSPRWNPTLTVVRSGKSGRIDADKSDGNGGRGASRLMGARNQVSNPDIIFKFSNRSLQLRIRVDQAK